MNKLVTDHITLGVCYYPEHWDKTLWRDDLRKMKQYGIEVVRIAEFAWSIFEPREGEFEFDFFDEFMDLTIEENIKVIFCTPSATPPAWMSQSYPEILNADIDGHLINHGLRRHCNLNSEKYRFFVSRITKMLAEHYSRYENIVAWQLDNEINCECDLYYSESDHKAFRKYLQNKFGTLDKFNEATGAVFWNQTYSSWDEVHLPRRTNSGRMGNPHIGLLEKHFISDTVISFFKLQADIIRRYCSAYITTNGVFRHIDYHRLTDKVLDFITYDNYPNFAYERTLDPSRQNGMKDRNSSYNLTRIRGISPIFGVMEQQSGPSGWNFRMEQPAPKPGQIRLWTLQAIAHGADFVSYFRWRTCTFGNEIYWHGLHDYCNKPNRRTDELIKTHSDIQRIQPACQQEYLAEAAILKDYDNEWDAEDDVWHGSADNISYDGWFCAFQKSHIPYDLVYINDDTKLSKLLKYKLIVYPHPTILTKRRAELLKAYAENGGTVIFGCRTGYKDLNGKCTTMPMPGYAAKLCGAEVEEFTFLSPYDEAQFINIGQKRISAPCFNDILCTDTAQVIGRYENNYYAGKTAITLQRTGRGKIYYFGAAFSEDSARAFIELEKLAAPLNLDSLIKLPESIELAIRGNCIFLLNYDAAAVTIKCRGAFRNIITDEKYSDSFIINGYDAAVIEKI